MFRWTHCIALVVGGLLTHASSLVAEDLHWSVNDKKTDKLLLDVDHRFVENSSGKRILVNDSARLEDADGKAVLDYDPDTSTGFSIRKPKDQYVRLLWSNGHQLCKGVSGKVVFDYDGRNRSIAINGSDRETYTVTCHNGNSESRLEAWQVVAIAYALQPKLFEVSKADAEAQRAEAAMNAKETEQFYATRLAGEFDVLSTNSPVFRDAKCLAKPVGKFVYMQYALSNGTKLQGIGVHKNPGEGNDQERILTALNSDGVVALGIYEVESGQLQGSWFPTSLLADPKASLGIENLKGKTGDKLAGKFTITEGKTPTKGEPYSGTLELKPIQRNDGGVTPTYELTWSLGTVTIKGIGIQVRLYDAKTKTHKTYLVAAVGNGEVLVGQHFGISSSDVHLDYAASGKTIAGDESTTGYIMLSKNQ